VPQVWAVVVAAGGGRRFGQPKQFARLGGRTVVEHAVAACRPAADAVVLVLPEGSCDERYGADRVVAGGPTRSDSVRRGLEAVPADVAVVIVHDAARPLARPALFAAVLGALAERGVGGAICAVPVTDTLKGLDPGAGLVASTVERAGLVAVQTPQAFVAQILRRAHAGEPEATDDAALVEALGVPVAVVAGDPRNLKLTMPEDLVLAEALLGA